MPQDIENLLALLDQIEASAIDILDLVALERAAHDVPRGGDDAWT